MIPQILIKPNCEKDGTSNKHGEQDFNYTISFSTRSKKTKVNPNFSDGIA
jgi:hypothetical protein